MTKKEVFGMSAFIGGATGSVVVFVCFGPNKAHDTYAIWVAGIFFILTGFLGFYKLQRPKDVVTQKFTMTLIGALVSITAFTVLFNKKDQFVYFIDFGYLAGLALAVLYNLLLLTRGNKHRG